VKNNESEMAERFTDETPKKLKKTANWDLPSNECRCFLQYLPISVKKPRTGTRPAMNAVVFCSTCLYLSKNRELGPAQQ